MSASSLHRESTDSLILTGMAAGLQEDKSVSLTLTISSYVSPGPSELLRTTELAQLFKDRIAHKLLTDIRTSKNTKYFD